MQTPMVVHLSAGAVAEGLGCRMAGLTERILARAATIDELLSPAYRPLPGQKADADLAASRLAAWCRASASGDWSLFAGRLHRDGLSIEDVLARFATVGRDPSVPALGWVHDAGWVFEAMRQPAGAAAPGTGPVVAFQEILDPVVARAEALMAGLVEPSAGALLTGGARGDLRAVLARQLSEIAAPAMFASFDRARQRGAGYLEFVSMMNSDGVRRLFEDNPVLLRLMASLTRQWIDTTAEMLTRLADDLPVVARELLQSREPGRVDAIEGQLSDPHNFGRCVRILRFEDGSRVVYKPKDLRVDAAWARMVDRLNASSPPVDLRAARVLPGHGFGWTEFIEHTGCSGDAEIRLFFRRAGAWLALFHGMVAVDMHQENIVACGSHPVPIDLEMVLQADDWRLRPVDPAVDGAFVEAMRTVTDSVLTVGLLPAYGRHSTSAVFVIGGVNSNSAPRTRVRWDDINTDTMQPVRVSDVVTTVSNLPYSAAGRGRLADHLDELTTGFVDYARFLSRQRPGDLLDGFAGVVTRTVIRPTRFYGHLLNRLRDHRTLTDGAVWSAQADFTVRLTDWDSDADLTWPLQRAERAALVDLNVPHFTTVSDGRTIRDSTGTAVRTDATPGLARAAARLGSLGDEEIAWQLEVIEQSTDLLRSGTGPARVIGPPVMGDESAPAVFAEEADAIAAGLAERAVRRGRSAAWIGLDWLGDSEMSQLVVLGPDLYNGGGGIAVFLAAHAAVRGESDSRRLALAAVSGLRRRLRGRAAAGLARSLGVGAGLGLGSVVYGLALVGALLEDDDVVSDARVAADLISDEVLAADRQLDVLGGSAGAILGLLRLYRQTGSASALRLAEKCGTSLLGRRRAGSPGRRTWTALGFGRPLNGMSHGAAGYAYALAALSALTGDDEFAAAAAECVSFERSTFDERLGSWADLRDTGPVARQCKWCYGSPGIGLARIAMTKCAGVPPDDYELDILRAVADVESRWPAATDSLCCGTLGSVEFLREAAAPLGRPDLADLAAGRLRAVVEAARAAGDYRWSGGTGRFNLGFFRGVAGIGYTLLRSLEPTLPNVLFWE